MVNLLAISWVNMGFPPSNITNYLIRSLAEETSFRMVTGFAINYPTNWMSSFKSYRKVNTFRSLGMV